MFRNHIQHGQQRPNGPFSRWIGLAAGFFIGLACCGGAFAEQDPLDHLPPEVRALFEPTVEPLENEDKVVCSSWFDRLPGWADHRARRWWQAGGGAVLDPGEPGLVLHFYAEGIDKMTPVDKAWEGFPQRAESLQHLMDTVIGRSRASGRPIRHLIVAGHAGLPGCSAWGGTMEDCTFKGVLSTYQRKQLARLRPYLAAGAEIELRQCGTGAGDAGERLLTAIYQVTGAATSSYLADFHFGDADNHPRVRVGPEGFEIISVQE